MTVHKYFLHIQKYENKTNLAFKKFINRKK